MKIGIAITTRNRHEIARETFAILDDMRPENSVFGIVDDASFNPPFGFATNRHNVFRFEDHVGVSAAKNKCLELLHNSGCTHFFLFDDDCRPVVDEWWLPYVNSKLNHAAYTFNRKLLKFTVGFHRGYMLEWNEYEKPNGCMMFFTRNCIDKIGGWDMSFKGYGYEHVNLSDRIFNARLTPARYIDIPNSKGLFEMANCESSFSSHDRMQIPNNFKLYQQNYYSKEFKPFK